MKSAIDILKDKKGSVTLIFVMGLFVCILTLVMVLDLSKTQSAKLDSQGATDSAALAAAHLITNYRFTSGDETGLPANLNEYAAKVIAQNMELDQSAYDYDANLVNVEVKGDKVIVEVCTTAKNNLSGVSGNAGTKVCSKSAATLPGFSNVEIVFALDTSQSMTSNGRMGNLKDAVLEIINKYGGGSGGSSIYWGVVPFRGMVNLGSHADAIVANDRNSGSYVPDTYETTNMTDDNTPKPLLDYFHTLIAVPLTERVDGKNSLDPTVELDEKPNGGSMLKAYWHHDKDYWFAYKDEQECDPTKPCETILYEVCSWGSSNPGPCTGGGGGGNGSQPGGGGGGVSGGSGGGG
ncbi:MAG: hypothetical protein COV36_00580 [Alphaproteobacteria bacterium CG11_big_fil_rev_8_21_14_0_20_44_7]|nr:MAG: hypothetical protein COV36_00580 [Alphaproteobacteria bacterium CG11_big_fil_rev_8_21_14_0_20_44_7]